MASLNIPNSFSNNTVADATQVNANFTSVKNFAESAVVQVDGSVKAPTVAIADSAITNAKLNNGASGDIPLVTVSTDNPTGGKNGDIWFKVL